jgi:putative tryptophan/tyrosine transport system substrate-binding protein
VDFITEAGMKSRREFLAMLGAGAYAVTFSCYAQQGRRRIGFLGPLSSPANAIRISALRAGMLGLGYAEGQNFSIEFRGQDRGIEQLRDLAAALVRSAVDVIVCHGTTETLAAKQATATIPIVMAAASDAVAMGLVANLQRPGGNVTGASYSTPQMMQRRFELLKEAYVPVRRVGVLVNPANPMTEAVLVSLRATAQTLKMEAVPLEARAPEDINNAFGRMVREKVHAFVITDDTLFTQNAEQISELARAQRRPGVGSLEYVEAGGLLSYQPNLTAAWGRAATFVSRIFRGSKVGDLAVEPATRFETVFNKQGAKAVGIVFPGAMLARADRVVQTGQDDPCKTC